MKGITRRTFLAGTATGLAVCNGMARAGSKPRRPNILWITCEDMSLHLGCYGDNYANTPNLDALAREGTRYTNAFTVAGVCAPSRSCLITGMYPTTLGTCHMRCNHAPPEHVRCFPAYLRRAGYYCTNNVKTDYQFDVPADAWDENSNKAHWRNRREKDQPFFAVFNSTITHESQIGNLNSLPKALASRITGGLHDPAHAELPPFYPDTEVIRKHWAHMYDLQSAMDVWAGDLLKQLDEDGLAGNTVVFFFSDHGDGIPRAKRWLYDSGLRVPLLVRWPQQLEANSVSDRLVSFVDFAPTVLSIAGVDIPAHMQGTPYLGARAGKPRRYVFGARDRMDERYDLIRAVRDSRYKYIRNYEPARAYDEYVSYNESWPVMQELRRVHDAGGLNEAQALFFRKTKPTEELYDTASDPFELCNLAEFPEHQGRLNELRGVLNHWIQDASDLGFVPETELDRFVPAARPDLRDRGHVKYRLPDSEETVFGKPLRNYVNVLNGKDKLARYRAVAAIGLAGGAAMPTLLSALGDSDVCVVHWAATGLGNLGKSDPAIVEALTRATAHASTTVRLAAARSLAMIGKLEAAAVTGLKEIENPDIIVRLRAAQILEMIDPKTEAITAALQRAMEDNRDARDYVPDVARHALGLPAQH